MNIFISEVHCHDQNHTSRHQTLLALNQIEGEINFVSLRVSFYFAVCPLKCLNAIGLNVNSQFLSPMCFVPHLATIHCCLF